MAPKPLDLPLERFALHYGALRDAIGKPGRLGAAVALLTPAPTSDARGDLTIDGLPIDATKVILFDRAGNKLDRFPITKRPLTVTPSGTVAWVEVYRKKIPILLGIPIS